MKRRSLIALLLAGALAACTLPTPEQNAELETKAKALYGDLVAKRDDALIQRMSSKNDAATVRAQLPMIRTFVPEGTPPEPKTVGVNVSNNNGVQRYALAQEYDYPDRVLRADTTFIKEGEAWKVEGFNVNAQIKPGVAPTTPPAAAPTAPAA